MGVLSEEYIMKKLTKYMTTASGKERVSKYRQDAFKHGNSFLSEKSITKTSEEIRDELADVILRTVHSFNIGAITVDVGEMDRAGQVYVSINIDEDALRRESLHYMNKNLSIGHGDGIDDILALFTHGYTLSKRPYGFWVRDNVTADALGQPMDRIGAMVHRDPNPFLSELVAGLNARYGNLCEITLNDKYTNGGG